MSEILAVTNKFWICALSVTRMPLGLGSAYATSQYPCKYAREDQKQVID